MKDYKIELKIIERSSVIGILGFFTDSKYLPDTPDSIYHMTDSICYIGFLDKIEEMVLQSNDIEKVVKLEIKKWHADMDVTIAKVENIIEKEQVSDLVKVIEEYINNVIKKRYD